MLIIRLPDQAFRRNPYALLQSPDHFQRQRACAMEDFEHVKKGALPFKIYLDSDTCAASAFNPTYYAAVGVGRDFLEHCASTH